MTKKKSKPVKKSLADRIMQADEARLEELEELAEQADYELYILRNSYKNAERTMDSRPCPQKTEKENQTGITKQTPLAMRVKILKGNP